MFSGKRVIAGMLVLLATGDVTATDIDIDGSSYTGPLGNITLSSPTTGPAVGTVIMMIQNGDGSYVLHEFETDANGVVVSHTEQDSANASEPATIRADTIGESIGDVIEDYGMDGFSEPGGGAGCIGFSIDDCTGSDPYVLSPTASW